MWRFFRETKDCSWGRGGVALSEPLLFELGRDGRPGPRLPKPGVKVRPLEEMVPQKLLRKEALSIPSLSEP
jgi:hypothetical protein